MFLLGWSAFVGGFASRWWGTYDQIRERGGQVRKGEKGTFIIFWKSYKKAAKDDKGNEKEESRPVLRYYNVFNETQADWSDGMPFTKVVEVPEVEPIEQAESVWQGYESRPELRLGGDRACYSPVLDVICMPIKEQFHTLEHYYSTLYHEAGHSTGHVKRLGREGIADLNGGHAFGDELYSKEELVAEMTATFLCAEAGIENAATVESSAAYLRHWGFKFKQEPKLFVHAAAAAQKAADHILGREFEQNGEG